MMTVPRKEPWRCRLDLPEALGASFIVPLLQNLNQDFGNNEFSYCGWAETCAPNGNDGDVWDETLSALLLRVCVETDHTHTLAELGGVDALYSVQIVETVVPSSMWSSIPAYEIFETLVAGQSPITIM